MIFLSHSVCLASVSVAFLMPQSHRFRSSAHLLLSSAGLLRGSSSGRTASLGGFARAARRVLYFSCLFE